MVANRFRSSGRALLFCMVIVLPITACQDKAPPAGAGAGEAAHTPQAPVQVEAPEAISPAAEAAAPPAVAPLDLTLPPGLFEGTSPLAQEEDEALLPELFEPEVNEPARISGKLLFQEEQQEGALDNINGAQLEFKIPVE